MANTNEEHDNGLVWAVIDSGTRRLLGRVKREIAFPGGSGKVQDATELQCQVINLPTPQGLAEMYHPTMKPVDLEEGPTEVMAIFSNIRLLEEMQDKGASLMQLRENFLQMLLNARAQRAGILPAKQMPKGGNFIG